MKQGTNQTRNRARGRVLLAAVSSLAAGIAAASGPAATVLVATGGVKAVSADGTARDLSRRSTVYAGDRLVTGSSARAQVKFSDGAIVSLKPRSELRIDQYAYEDGAASSVMSLIKGGFRTMTGAIGKLNKSAYKVNTPVATIGIRGTVYEADFDPESGLGMGVWDGGITACNDNGCLDLGTDVEHRFGFIPVDGSRGQGLNAPPEGLGDDESSDEVGGDGSIFDRLRSDMLDEDIVLFIPGDSAAIERQLLPFSGFAVVGQSAGSNPWGTADLLNVEFADVEQNAYIADLYGAGYGGYRDVWTLKSSTAAGYINSVAAYGGSASYASGYVNRYDYGVLGGTRVFFGSWYNYDNVSFGNYPLQPTDTLVPNAGMFVVGDWASPGDIATLTGSVNFLLRDVMALDGSGSSVYLAGQEGLMNIDMGSGAVSGNIDLADYSSNAWRLLFAGEYSAGDFDLSIVTDAGAPANGSYYTPAAGGPMAIAGNIDAAFVGSDGVDGVVGAFSVATIDNPVSASLQGVFGMELEVPYTGFAVASDDSGVNPWGSTRLLDVDWARVRHDNYYTVNDWSLSSPTLAGQFLNPVGYDYGQIGSAWLSYGDKGTQVYWGYWQGDGGVDLAAAPGEAGSTLLNGGAFVLSRESPEAVVQASLTGNTRFDLAGGAVVENGVAGSTTLSGDMFVNMDTGSVDGKLGLYNNSTFDAWTLAFDGTVSASGMNLDIVAGSDASGAGSYFAPFNWTDEGDYLGVDGSISASFIGLQEVDGIVGAFDVYTQDLLHTAQGVFVMERDPSYSGYAVVGNTNQWGPERLLQVSSAFVIGDYSSVSALALQSPTIGTDFSYINSASSFQSGQVFSTSVGYESSTQVYWGYWAAGSEMALSNDALDGTGPTLSNPGLFVLSSSTPDASVVQASLVGETEFTIDTVAVLENGITYGVPETYTGNMLVDLGSGSASGSLALTTVDANQWSLAYSGTASASGLNLNVIAGQDGVEANSYYLPFESSIALGVQGTIQASFVGSTEVHGIVGAFDVQTLDTTQSLQGVFAMDAPYTGGEVVIGN